MSGKTLYLLLSIAAVSLGAAALAWLAVAPWRLERLLAEVSTGTLEPTSLLVFGGPLVLGLAAVLVRLRAQTATGQETDHVTWRSRSGDFS